MSGTRSSVQDAIFADCTFYGYHEEKVPVVPATDPETLRWPELTDAIKVDARERFEDFLMDVDVCASMVLPPNQHTRPDIMTRAKVSTFTAGLRDEAKEYFDTLGRAVKRDYGQLVLKFRQRYVDSSEDEADRRRATLERFKAACAQGSKTLMQYMADGVFYYDQVDDRFKCDSPAAIDHLERNFVDRFTDQSLSDAIWAYLVSNNRVKTFKPRDLVEVVKQLRYRQWNFEDYSKALEALKTDSAADFRPSQSSEDVKTLVKMGQGFVTTMTTVNQNLSKVTDKIAGLHLAGTSTASTGSAPDNGYGRGAGGLGRGSYGPPRGGYGTGFQTGAGRGRAQITCWQCNEQGHYSTE